MLEDFAQLLSVETFRILIITAFSAALNALVSSKYWTRIQHLYLPVEFIPTWWRQI